MCVSSEPRPFTRFNHVRLVCSTGAGPVRGRTDRDRGRRGRGAKVKDEGKLFTDGAEKEANAIIADTMKRFNKEVRVEAYNRPPADKVAEFEQKKRDRVWRERFFKQWAEQQTRTLGTNGVLVLLYRDKRRRLRRNHRRSRDAKARIPARRYRITQGPSRRPTQGPSG